MKEQAKLDYIDTIAGDDEVFRKKFIGILQSELPLEKAQYENNIVTGAYRAASENVHKIRHKINALGLDQSYEMAVQHESALRENDPSGHIPFMEVLDYMEYYLKTIRV
ncbi:histidine kinase [Sediminicola luteus]|uniref:HPt domain-containing protein n=1 Tax=Sediminicola luteus TaxID=319238 RepID=A0A2A4G3G7_9FLAO|nr:histidine kinase [Sediminicola luteus]PCE62524.1 hypothetical protein B7P33_17970 [Sediminicola luteus]